MATRAGELDSSNANVVLLSSPDQDDEPLRRFHQTPGIHTAGDALGLLSSAPERGSELLPVISFIESSDKASNLLKSAASIFRERIEGREPQVIENQIGGLVDRGSEIGKIRAALRASPRNPTKWVDLALAQTLVGEVAKAERSILTAIGMAPANRFVLRSAVRFYMHIAEPDRARSLFDGSHGSQDPWILAAELTTDTAAEKAPRSMKEALTSLASGNLAPWSLSELACSVAHLEFNEGRDKRAKKILRQALQEPTENAAAQIEFESQRGGFEVPESLTEPPQRHEARAIEASARGDWTTAVINGRKWQLDQPFALEPAMFLSYVAAVGAEDYPAAEKAAEVGRIANPENSMLINNLAFALANQDKVGPARDLFEKPQSHSLDAREQAVRWATEGLIAFREGNVARGRASYERSVRESLDLQLPGQAALAASYWAREEVRAGASDTNDALDAAVALCRRSAHPDASLVLSRINLTGGASQRGISRFGVSNKLEQRNI